MSENARGQDHKIQGHEILEKLKHTEWGTELSTHLPINPSFTDSHGYKWYITENKTNGYDCVRVRNNLNLNTPNNSIINLEKEIFFFMAQKVQTFNACVQDQKIKIGLDQLLDKFNKIFSGYQELSKTNTEWDIDRTTFTDEAEKKLVELFGEKIGNKAKLEEIKHAFEVKVKTTTALGHGAKDVEIDIAEENKATVNVMIGAKNTAHDLEPIKDTSSSVMQYHFANNALKRNFEIKRTALIVPEKKSKVKNLTKDEQITQTLENIRLLRKRNTGTDNDNDNDNDNDKITYYNLLTSIPIFDTNESKNQQVSRSNILFEAQDQYNHELLKNEGNVTFGQKNKPFLTIQIPTNGHGYEMKPFSFSPLAREIALRNDFAIALRLGNDEKKKNLLETYDEFLRKVPRKTYMKDDRGTKDKINRIVNEIKNSFSPPEQKSEDNEIKNPFSPPEQKSEDNERFSQRDTLLFGAADSNNDNDDQFKKALHLIFSQNLHREHKYAALTQTLLSLTDDNSYLGCKSGNERTAGILGRMENFGELKEQFEHILSDKDTTINSVQKCDKLVKITDELYNEKSLYGMSTDIALNDQGATSKIQTRYEYRSNWNPINWFRNISIFFYNLDTNRAEPPALSNLQNKNTSKMQAHKWVKQINDFFSSILKHINTTNDSDQIILPALGSAVSNEDTEQTINKALGRNDSEQVVSIMNNMGILGSEPHEANQIVHDVDDPEKHKTNEKQPPPNRPH